MDNISRYILVFSVFIIGYYIDATQAQSSDHCSWIFEHARKPCDHPADLKLNCEGFGCCWNEEAVGDTLKCYSTECSPGYFGWGCRFSCRCSEGETCDRETGACSGGCPAQHWGVGCLLDNECTYNDKEGVKYMGKQTLTKEGHTCGNWTRQRAYPDDQFPDQSRQLAGSSCRNPKPKDYKTWCYYAFGSNRRWDYCQLKECDCTQGRYGVNCEFECHCADISEQCHQVSGECGSGCHHQWKGSNCQVCATGFFGPLCDHQCHCQVAAEQCDQETGACSSDCALGWMGDDCQTACADGWYGFGCENKCNCEDPDEPCSKTNGNCTSGCKASYSGPGCQIQCRCRDLQEQCSPVDGSCHSGCSAGWVGLACDIEVPVLSRAPMEASRDANSITVEWNRWKRPPDRGDGPVIGYFMYYKALNVPEWKSERVSDCGTKAQEKCQHSIQGLRRGTPYQIKVLPIHHDGFSGFASPLLNISTCGKPRYGPIGLQLDTDATPGRSGRRTDIETPTASADNVQLQISWELPPSHQWGCDKVILYKIYLKHSSETQLQLVKEVQRPSASISSIDMYSNYTIGVSMVNSAHMESDPTLKAYLGKCGPVEDLEGIAHSPTAVEVRWAPPIRSNSEMSYYVIRYKELRIGSCDVVTAQWNPRLDLDGTEYTITRLKPYSRYRVRVWGQTASGQGQVSEITVVTQPTEPSAKIGNFHIVDVDKRQAHFTWEPLACEDTNGEFNGYKYQLTNNQDGQWRVIKRDLVNTTQLALTDLVPFTSYSITVWYVNHVFNGPKITPQEFKTNEDTPPPPRDLHIRVALSDSLTVAWEAPSPPHGILRKFEVKQISDKLGGSPIVNTLDASTRYFEMKKLLPNTSYAVQVRALTAVGPGPWSSMVYGFTDEALPGPPHSFINISRTASSLTFLWAPPVKENGILRKYKILCTPLTSLGQYLSKDIEEELDAGVRQYTVAFLKAGTGYTCLLKASTRKGYGEPLRKTFWTEPQLPVAPQNPELKLPESTDNSLTIKLEPLRFISTDIQNSQSVYRVVVEMIQPAPGKLRRRRNSPRVSMPCDLEYSDLRDYKGATDGGYACYIAAEIPQVVDSLLFVVGDNKTYGGYFNAPLETGRDYDIWYGLELTVDGVTAASYSRMDVTAHVQRYSASGDGSTAAMAGAVLGVMLVVIALGIVVGVLYVKRQRALRAEKSQLTDTTETDRLDSSSPSGHRMDKVVLPDLCSTNMDDTGIDEMQPLYDNTMMQIARKPVCVDILWNYVKEKKADDVNGFRQEYEELPMGLRAQCEVSRRPENKIKNRYGNIVAYDHSRVLLECLPDDPHSDYINANYIDGYCKPNVFIATQGPSKNTVHDIWRMAWQENSHRIVMVTNLVEDGRHKCEQYWPDSQSNKQYGDITIEHVDSEQFADFTIRTFNMTKNTTTKTVYQFHFTTWPDHGVPTHATSLLAFRKKVRSFDDPTSGPSIIHCSAGVGRSGTFIALDVLLDQAHAESQVDVYHCVQSMRQQRVNMVQTQDQYVFVYDALLEALKSGDTSISCTDFRKCYLDLRQVNPESGLTGLDKEFELLNTMAPMPDSSGCKDSLDSGNVDKNRYKDIVPMDNLSRPYLLTYIPGSTDYINAVFVDGYKQRDAFIITQMPLPITQPDFWAMIYDHDCHTIIMMNPLDTMDTTCACYYPTDSTSLQFGPFSVETITLDTTNEDVTVRDLSLTYNKRGATNEPRFVRQFQYNAWPRNATLPNSRSSLISLLTLVEKWQQRSGNHTIVAHCMDGATMSGLYCAVSYMVERLKVEQEVDVFQSIKHTRVSRPQIVASMEQYKFVYDMAVEYMDCFETYANFK